MEKTDVYFLTSDLVNKKCYFPFSYKEIGDRKCDVSLECARRLIEYEWLQWHKKNCPHQQKQEIQTLLNLKQLAFILELKKSYESAKDV